MDLAHEPAQIAPYLAPRTTTVFTSGNSQAVRLPKEFRFDSKQVFIERRGAEIVLRERKETMAEFLAMLPHIPDAPLNIDDEFPEIDEPIEAW
jgi:antitoxin VapB